MEDLALHTFLVRLNPRLARIVRSLRDPESINAAIRFAVAEEKFSITLKGHLQIIQTRSLNSRNPDPTNHVPQFVGRKHRDTALKTVLNGSVIIIYIRHSANIVHAPSYRSSLRHALP